MGEAIISRGYTGVDGAPGGYELKTEIITENTTWVVPKAKDQSFSVRIFGGGGGGYANSIGSRCGGGGGGYMNNAILNLTNGHGIQITIGTGGNGITYFNCNATTSSADIYESAGGTTFFGNYLC